MSDPSRSGEAGTDPGGMVEFDVLLTEIRACQICAAYLPLGPRPILQVHPEAVILIAGQAPGRRVHASGIPFQDPSGVRLREWMGVNEEVFYDPRRVSDQSMESISRRQTSTWSAIDAAL